MALGPRELAAHLSSQDVDNILSKKFKPGLSPPRVFDEGSRRPALAASQPGICLVLFWIHKYIYDLQAGLVTASLAICPSLGTGIIGKGFKTKTKKTCRVILQSPFPVEHVSLRATARLEKLRCHKNAIVFKIRFLIPTLIHCLLA